MEHSSPHVPITSKDNRVVKYIRSLSEHKHRKKEQAFVIEGLKMAEEALRYQSELELIIATPSLLRHHGKNILKLAEDQSVEVLWISDKLMDTLAETKTPQPVMAIVNMKEDSEEKLLTHESGLIIVCNGLQDPGNLGTIIRTAEAAGASGVAITSDTVDPYNSKTVRASMGSILRVSVAKISDVGNFIKKCKQNNFQTAAMTLEGDKTPFELDLKKPTVIIVGQEGSGLPEEVVSITDYQVRIPMAETIDSLNTAVSAAVFLYEAVRQRARKFTINK